MAHATPDDVATYLMRDLTEEEEGAALQYLDIIELVIRRTIKDFDDQLMDSDFDKAVVYVEASIVSDILSNPNRYQYEQAGDYSYSLQRVLQVDSLRGAITDDMWWLLGVKRGGAFTINTAVWTDTTRSPRWWTPTDKW